jgi:hypothetical protein
MDQMLAVASDQLAEHLDAVKGSSVSDHSIFRAHAAKYEVCVCVCVCVCVDTVVVWVGGGDRGVGWGVYAVGSCVSNHSSSGHMQRSMRCGQVWGWAVC